MQTETITDVEHKPPLAVLAADMERFIHDPLGFVYYAFPWGEGELQEYTGPDTWQTEVLQHITDKLQAKAAKKTTRKPLSGTNTKPSDIVDHTIEQATAKEELVSAVIRIALSAGNGPGKSAIVAWLILWAMATYEDTKGVVTANTDTQLRTKTWSELAKWYRLCITKHFFVLTATAIYAKDKEHERTWRIDQVPWSEEKTEAFAGLHNKGKRILLIFDEASAIPDKIWEVSDGAMTDKDTEIIWLVSGNPTRNTGRFRECWGKFRHRWAKWQIDTRKSKLVNQAEVKGWIEDLGLDSDWVRVHVLGQFPKASDLQFISNAIVEAAAGRKAGQHQYHYAPKIIGLDPAWTGGDEIVIYLRQGIVAKKLKSYPKNDDDSVIAGDLAKFEDSEKADAVFIDQGYGTGIYSFGKKWNKKWTLVSFASKSGTVGFKNKRSEMWGKMKQWLIDGGCIPDEPTIIADLTAPEIQPNMSDTIQLESKERMKKRGLASPSHADGLALTFAFPVFRKRLPGQIGSEREFAKSDYNVLDPAANQ